MGKETGFIEFERENQSKRPVEERIKDFNQIYIPMNYEKVKIQAARCMDCGAPFCTSEYGCPLGNAAPEINDLALFALGFLHPEHETLLGDLGVELDERGNVKTDEFKRTSVKGVYAAGDMRSGQSLVCKAISDGRKAARTIDLDIMGQTNLR